MLQASSISGYDPENSRAFTNANSFLRYSLVSSISPLCHTLGGMSRQRLFNSLNGRAGIIFFTNLTPNQRIIKLWQCLPRLMQFHYCHQRPCQIIIGKFLVIDSCQQFFVCHIPSISQMGGEVKTSRILQNHLYDRLYP